MSSVLVSQVVAQRKTSAFRKIATHPMQKRESPTGTYKREHATPTTPNFHRSKKILVKQLFGGHYNATPHHNNKLHALQLTTIDSVDDRKGEMNTKLSHSQFEQKIGWPSTICCFSTYFQQFVDVLFIGRFVVAF